MRLFCYVVARDYGFAPNPFHGYCTLATCKPKIRGSAQVGDWIIGAGSSNYRLAGHLVFAMEVSEVLSFDEYWKDPRFEVKKPQFNSSLMKAYGDNIYHFSKTKGRWIQEDSHHSRGGGRPNRANISHDTQVSRVLVGQKFIYFGGGGPMIPKRLRKADGPSLCGGRGHRNRFPPRFVAAVVRWLEALPVRGFAGKPAEF